MTKIEASCILILTGLFSGCSYLDTKQEKQKSLDAAPYYGQYNDNHKPCLGEWMVKITQKPNKILASEKILVSNSKVI